jgi:hypothetical protein
MEAGAAVGLAGNIVQFLDFSQKLTKTILEIWKSTTGSTKSNQNLAVTVQTFLQGLDSVASDLQEYRGFLGQLQPEIQDDHIQIVIEGCRHVADDLVSRLEKLRTTSRSTRWNALVTALKCLWKESELEEMDKQLGRLRRELETRVLFSLRYGHCGLCGDLGPR